MPTALLEPAALLAIRDLELRARAVMEGLATGLHRSPYSGFSSEFTEYRQYSPGDDLRHLDWKAYARTDRFFIKKHEAETNLHCLLILDTSRSMAFASAGVTKLDYARTLAATLASFLNTQRDVVGVALFDRAVHHVVPPRWRPGHLQHLYAALSRDGAEKTTVTGAAFAEVARLCRKRTLIVLLSDLLAPAEDWRDDFAQLAAAGHDLRVLQVLDPAELSLDFGRAAVWEDLENDTRLYVDPGQARDAYRERIEHHLAAVRDLLHAHGALHQQVVTTTPPAQVLREFLSAAPLSPTGRRST